jgi:hypothetical protein
MKDTDRPGLSKEVIFKAYAECAVEVSDLAINISVYRELKHPEIRVVQRYGAKHYVDYADSRIYKQENIRDTINDYRLLGVNLVCDSDIIAMERIERDTPHYFRSGYSV